MKAKAGGPKKKRVEKKDYLNAVATKAAGAATENEELYKTHRVPSTKKVIDVDHEKPTSFEAPPVLNDQDVSTAADLKTSPIQISSQKAGDAQLEESQLDATAAAPSPDITDLQAQLKAALQQNSNWERAHNLVITQYNELQEIFKMQQEQQRARDLHISKEVSHLQRMARTIAGGLSGADLIMT